MHWSRGYHALITWHSCTDHVADHTLLTRLIMHRSRLYHALITWLPMHWSRGWSYTNHVTDRALITWLIIHWYRDWAWTDHMIVKWSVHAQSRYHVDIMHLSRACHTLIPWLSMNWSLDYHVVITWLNGADHVTDHVLIMFAIIHWSCASGGNKQRAE